MNWTNCGKRLLIPTGLLILASSCASKKPVGGPGTEPARAALLEAYTEMVSKIDGVAEDDTSKQLRVAVAVKPRDLQVAWTDENFAQTGWSALMTSVGQGNGVSDPMGSDMTGFVNLQTWSDFIIDETTAIAGDLELIYISDDQLSAIASGAGLGSDPRLLFDPSNREKLSSYLNSAAGRDSGQILDGLITVTFTGRFDDELDGKLRFICEYRGLRAVASRSYQGNAEWDCTVDPKKLLAGRHAPSGFVTDSTREFEVAPLLGVALAKDGSSGADPGDTADTADEFALDSSASVSGEIGYGDDLEDWYRFVPPSNGVLDFQVYNDSRKGSDRAALGGVEILEGATKSLGRTGIGRAPQSRPVGKSISVSGGVEHYVRVYAKPSNKTKYRVQFEFLPN